MMNWFRSLSLVARLSVIGLLVGVATFIFQSVFDVPSFPVPSPGLQRYTNPSAGFALSFPKGWLVLQTPTGSGGDPTVVVTINYPKFPSTGIDVAVRRSVATYTTLQEVQAWGDQINSKSFAYHELSTTATSLGGEETLLREYTLQLHPSTSTDSSLQCFDNYRLHEHRAYILSLCAGADDFAGVKPTFRQIIESFSFRN